MSEKTKHEELDLPIKSLNTIRNEILNVLLIAISFFAILPMAASLNRIAEIGWQNIMYFHIISYVAIVTTTIFHRRLRYQYKATVLISFCFLIGCIATASMGLIGSGILFMVFSIILATMFFGIRYGIVLITGGLLFLTAVAYGVKRDWVVFDFSIETAALSLPSWISKISVFALFSTILIYSLGRLIKYLVDSSKNSKEYAKELGKINDKLMQEIYEKKQAEKRLQSSDERYRSLVNTMQDIIYSVSEDGIILFIGPQIERYGFTVEEMTSQPFIDNIFQEDRDSVLRKFQHTLATGEETLMTFRIVTKDGNVVWFEEIAGLVRDAEGNIVRISGILRDINERKRAEKAQEVLKARLQQTQKMEAVGTLAGGIAHDFNNILSPLIGFSEILKEDLPDSSPLQRYTDEILSAAFRAKDLVKQILAFSRQADQDIKPIKLQPIVKEVFKLLRSSIPTTIDIQLDIDPDCGVVIADPTQVHQVVMNLATNAYHAMEDTGGRLQVNLKQIELKSDELVSPELAPGEYALLTVTDTGTGIDKDILDKIFDPYFTTKEKNRGTGLGLSVVQGIIKSCNGDIRINSESGKGTEIHVCLPIIDQKVIEIQSDERGSIQGGAEKILLVDDEEAIARIEQVMLERLGYRVTMRTGSVDTLEAFKADPDSFDLIVTDMTMPNMTGLQLTEEIKKIRPDIPVILCTGFSYQVNAEKSKELGIQGFVLKPVVMKEFAKTIRNILDNSNEC